MLSSTAVHVNGHTKSKECLACASRLDAETAVKVACEPFFEHNVSGVQFVHRKSSSLPAPPHSPAFLSTAMPVESNIDVMLCQSAHSMERLQELQKTWLDAANTNPSIGVQVFMPITVNTSRTSLLGTELNIALLEGWTGTKGSFQESMARAIVPCMKQKPNASFYAIMDDDIVVDPGRLVEWVRSLPVKRHAVWGRQACCGIVFGGMLIMPWKTAAAAVQQMDTMVTHVAVEVKKRRFVCCKDTPFNLDHFFSIMVEKIGGSVVTAPQIQEFQEWQRHAGEITWPFPARLVALHHMNSERFATLSRIRLATRINNTTSNSTQVLNTPM